MNFIRRFINSNSEERNIYHSDYRNLVEPAFKIGSTQFYRFKDTKDVPHMRVFFYGWYVDQYELGMKFETALAYSDKIDELANKGYLGDVITVNRLFKERMKNNMGLDILYEVASVLYFTDDEDLEQYSVHKNKPKVELFRNNKEYSFFLTSPMIDYFPQLTSFRHDFETFSTMVESIRELTEEIDSVAFSLSDKRN